MPGYQTHITWSSVAGVGLGCLARYFYDVSIPQSVFGGVLCALGGVLPDVDSDNSRAFQRCLSTIAGTFSLLFVNRLRDFALDSELVVMSGAFVYFAVYYGLGKFIKRNTVHRGMCHSLPFGVIAGELVFILSSGGTQLRLFKAAAIFLGVLVHLTLDEIYSVETSGKQGRKIYLKNSFGTALKLIDYKHLKSTIAFYVVAALLANVAMNVQAAINAADKSNNKQKIQGKAAVDRVRLIYPTQFDLSAVQWVAENDFVLSPGTPDNAKWAELERLLALDNENNDEASPVGAPDVSADAPNAAPKKRISLLDLVNWNSRNADQENDDQRNNESAPIFSN